MPTDRRRDLVDAGISLVAEQRFQELLASVDTRSITERAGVTTGSFFHHFRNRAAFTGAVAARFRELWDSSVDQLVQDIDTLTTSDDPGKVRTVAQADWDKLEREQTAATLLHLLWAARRQPLVADEDRTAGDVLHDAYASLAERAIPAFRRALAAMGREPMPPFELVDLSVAMTALADGIQMREEVQPEAVRPALFADVVAGMLFTITRPVGEASGPADLATLEAGLSVSARPGVTAPLGEGQTWRQIADAAAPLFDRRPLADVRVAEVAAAAGVSTSTVYHHFASITEVAASGWVRFVPELQALASEPITAAEGPIRRIEQLLTRIVELGRDHRSSLEALMAEAVAATGRGDGRSRAIGELVPLADMIAPLLRELRTRGQLRRRLDSLGVARAIVQLVAMRVLVSPDDPVERIVDDSLGLVLDGALTTARPGR